MAPPYPVNHFKDLSMVYSALPTSLFPCHSFSCLTLCPYLMPCGCLNHALHLLSSVPSLSTFSPWLISFLYIQSPALLSHAQMEPPELLSQAGPLFCSPLSLRVCSNWCPFSWWCYLTISFSASPFSSCPQSFPASGFFSNESALRIRWPKYWSFTFSNRPSNEYLGLISFRTDWFDLLGVQGTLKSLLQHHNLKALILQCSAFLMVQLLHLNMTPGKIT